MTTNWPLPRVRPPTSSFRRMRSMLNIFCFTVDLFNYKDYNFRHIEMICDDLIAHGTENFKAYARSSCWGGLSSCSSSNAAWLNGHVMFLWIMLCKPGSYMSNFDLFKKYLGVYSDIKYQTLLIILKSTSTLTSQNPPSSGTTNSSTRTRAPLMVGSTLELLNHAILSSQYYYRFSIWGSGFFLLPRLHQAQPAD